MSNIEVQVDAHQKPPGRKTKIRKGDARYGKSAVSNCHELLPNVDARSAVARRFRDIVSAILVDQGSANNISEARLQLIRRFSAASCIAEQMEAQLANGDEIDLSAHAQLCSSLVRIANKIGINRIPYDVTPDDPLEYSKQFDEAV
jgi:hypothetical protein